MQLLALGFACQYISEDTLAWKFISTCGSACECRFKESHLALFFFYLHLFSLDSAAISIHTKSKQWGRRMSSKQIMALIQMNSGGVFFSDTVLPALVICICLYMFPFEAWGTLLVPPRCPRAKKTIREYNEHKQWWRLNLTFFFSRDRQDSQM